MTSTSYHGTNDEILGKGVGHLKETAFPIGGVVLVIVILLVIIIKLGKKDKKAATAAGGKARGKPVSDDDFDIEWVE